MKEIIKCGFSFWGRMVIVTIMCIFLCMSMSVLATAAFTDNIGYEAYGVKEGSDESVHLYTYYNKDGEDTKKAEFEKQGYTVSTNSIRSELSGGGNAAFLVVTQIFTTLLTVSFIYPNMWQLGAKDSNLVKFKHKAEDKFKGLKIGLLGSIPAFVLWVALFVCRFAKPDFPIALYRFLNCSNYSFIYAVTKNAEVGKLSIIQLVLLLVLLLIFPAVAYGAYLLGYKDISLSEKLIYKKTKN